MQHILPGLVFPIVSILLNEAPTVVEHPPSIKNIILILTQYNIYDADGKTGESADKFIGQELY